MKLNDLYESALPMDKASRMERAKAMGFNTVAYHGTTAKFNEFDMERGKANHSGFAPFFSDQRSEAKGYADMRKDEGEAGHVMNVLLRIRKPLIVPDTWAKTPEDWPQTDHETYAMVTGGQLPTDSKRRNRTLTTTDALDHAMDIHYEETGNYNRREIWAKIYARLRAAGYDAIIWQDTRADHSNGSYNKIVMLDMSGIRLASARFDPAKASSTDLRA